MFGSMWSLRTLVILELEMWNAWISCDRELSWQDNRDSKQVISIIIIRDILIHGIIVRRVNVDHRSS